MFVLENYTFTPGQAGVGTIVIDGVFSLENFYNIINVTRGATIYETVSEHDRIVSCTVADGETTLVLADNTVYWDSSDKIQITCYPFGTSAGVVSDVNVLNFPATQTVDGTVDVGNFPTTFDVGNFPATQTVDGTVTADQGTSPWVVSGTTTAAIGSFPLTATDAFNRLRVSQPLTLFDSSHRYADNNLWATSTATGGTAVFNQPQGLVDLTVTGTTGSKVYRETTKVFSYQPGKSLLVDNTFVFAEPRVGLRQRAGYFGADNGYFLETDGLTINFVERSLVTGGVTETRVAQADWNYDPMDGSGPSGIDLTITNAQILWMDLQWLGVGTVRMGFEINGQPYLCHQWQHANLIPSTYITTASLPLRIELENTGTTGVASTLKQICSTVISEGGYTLNGLQQGVGTPVTTPRTLTTAGTYYPVVSLRLKAARLDAIVILTAISLLGNGNNETFRWQVMASSTVTAGTWVSAGSDSSVEYNLTGTGISGGRILAAGYTTSSNQGSPTIDILREALFTFQLERDTFTATPYTLSIAIAGAAGNVTCYASVDWEEVSR